MAAIRQQNTTNSSGGGNNNDGPVRARELVCRECGFLAPILLVARVGDVADQHVDVVPDNESCEQ